MRIQTPKSIKKIATEIERIVVANFPHIMCIEDMNVALQCKFEETCDHELFYQDVNRFISDVYSRESSIRNTDW